jgi:hypothetical protein
MGEQRGKPDLDSDRHDVSREQSGSLPFQNWLQRFLHVWLRWTDHPCGHQVASPRADGARISKRVPSAALVEGCDFEMIGITFVLCFALCAIASWRVAHLLARENGPWRLIARLRASLDSCVFGRLMNHFYCWSLLLSLPPAIWMSSSRIGFLVEWLALSAIVCLLEAATQRQQRRLYASLISKDYLDKVIRGV